MKLISYKQTKALSVLFFNLKWEATTVFLTQQNPNKEAAYIQHEQFFI